jgi:hypothetical protein
VGVGRRPIHTRSGLHCGATHTEARIRLGISGMGARKSGERFSQRDSGEAQMQILTVLSRIGDALVMWAIAGLAVALVLGRIIQAAKIREGR